MVVTDRRQYNMCKTQLTFCDRSRNVYGNNNHCQMACKYTCNNRIVNLYLLAINLCYT